MTNPFTRLFRARDKPDRSSPQNAVSAAPTFYFGSSFSGKSVTARSAIQLSTVYACVRVISETVASLPLNVYEVTERGGVRALEHPLQRLLHDEPNPEMTSFVWRETMLSHLLLWGNSYCQIIRNGRNGIVGLYPLLPDHMEVDRDSKGRLTYTYTTSEGRIVRLAPEDVLHIPGLGFDGVMGYSPIALEKSAVGLSIAAEEYGSKFFGNGAMPSGVLTHPNTVKDPKRLRESWNAAYGGSANSGKVAILEESMSFTPISIPNDAAQFLETRKFQVTEICRIFRVPPHMIGDLERATFSNIESSEHLLRRPHHPPMAGAHRAGDEPRAVLGERKSRKLQRPAVLCAVQPGRPDARRLQEPHGRLRHSPPERLDERQRHTRAGEPESDSGRGWRQHLSVQWQPRAGWARRRYR